jgi:preprotein translocase subunit SecF
MASQKKIIDFMGKRRIAAALSVLLVLISIASLATKGLNYGLDFTGGTLIEVGYSEPAELATVRTTLEQAGYTNAVVVHFGSEKDVLVRLPAGYSDTLGAEVVASLQESTAGKISLRRIEFVGPQVGSELREQGGLAMLTALLVVMLYVAIRFQYKFSVGAVVALAHDVLITLGLFSVFGWEFDLTVLAALLAVIGYSLNDTIVVSDRIRENFRKIRKESPQDVINISLTQTLGRTVVTSFTTLLVLSALFAVGGELIHAFSVALIVGVLVGTYSSIYVAANTLLLLKIGKEDLMLPEKEAAEIDDMP